MPATNNRRLILVPQLPVKMRYSEWWIKELRRNLAPYFNEVVVLGETEPQEPETASHFTLPKAAIDNELRQIQEYMNLTPESGDVLFHADISFPGLFHSILFHVGWGRKIVFCHATAANKGDIFENVAVKKYGQEILHATLYDRVLVASDYSRRKFTPTTINLGCLPMVFPVPDGQDEHWDDREIQFCSVSRPVGQKVDLNVEYVLKHGTGKEVVRPPAFSSWLEYGRFLSSAKFLVVTAKEETYGYAAFDAWAKGCVPILPRRCCYPEFWPDEVLYNPDQCPEGQAKEIYEISQRVKSVTPKNKNLIPKFYEKLVGELLG